MKTEVTKTDRAADRSKWTMAAFIAAAVILTACGSADVVAEPVQSDPVATTQPVAAEDAAPSQETAAAADQQAPATASDDAISDPTLTDPAVGISFYHLSGLGVGVVVPGSFEQVAYDDTSTSYVHSPTGVTVFVGATDELVSGNGGDRTVVTWTDIMGSGLAGEVELYVQGEQNGDPDSVRALIDAGNRTIEVTVIGGGAQAVFDNVIRDMTIIDPEFWVADGEDFASLSDPFGTEGDDLSPASDAFAEDLTYNFFVGMPVGFVVTPPPASSLELYTFENAETGVAVTVYGTERMPEPGDQVGTFPLMVDNGDFIDFSSEAPLWESRYVTADGRQVIVNSIQTPTHFVVVEVSGPEAELGNTMAEVLSSLLVLDPSA